MREILSPARQGALVLAAALAVVYAVGGWSEVAAVLGVGFVMVAAWAWCAAGGRADAAADAAARTASARVEALR